jgi:hypothetical protein
MQRRIHLALYGNIEHGPDQDMAWDLYQSEALTRLRDISLSSVPSRFAPHGVATSRFQHSVAVGYLARRLCERRSSLREHGQLLCAAGLLHDIGSPPFSHISEIFFYALTGRTHEEQTERLLRPSTELGSILRRYGVDPDRVVELVTGRDPHLGALIAGSIDLDNVSNTIDLLASLGYHNDLPYHPMRLLDAFRYRNRQLVLDAAFLPELLGWAKARRMLYGLLHSEPNLSAATMLYRAIEFAFAEGGIRSSFFALGESDALSFLRYDAGPHAAALVDAELRWRHFPLLGEWVNHDEDPRLRSLYEDWEARKRFTDQLAAALGIPAHELTLYVGVDRGEKAITLPFIGEAAGPAVQLFAGRTGRQRLSLFAHKRHRRLQGSRKLADTTRRLVSELPENHAPAHEFY